MESFKELKQAIKNQSCLFWVDPCPIESNNYSINFIQDLSDIDDFEDPFGYPILINYGKGSEAEVYISEIIIKK